MYVRACTGHSRVSWALINRELSCRTWPASASPTAGVGALPVMQQVRDEARRREVDLIVLPTAEAIGVLTGAAAHTNAILHLTC